MARSWSGLSAPYRARLERAGITPQAYESGVNVSAARGHAATPERPSRAANNPAKYARYLQRQSAIRQAVIDKKHKIFGGLRAYNAQRSAQQVLRSDDLQAMRRFLAASDDDAYDMHSEQDFDDSDNWYMYH